MSLITKLTTNKASLAGLLPRLQILHSETCNKVDKKRSNQIGVGLPIRPVGKSNGFATATTIAIAIATATTSG